MHMRTIIAGALAIAGAACLSQPALAQGKAATLRIGWTSTDSPQDPYGIGANLFKQKVEALAPGKIQVSLFPNRQIGDEKELLVELEHYDAPTSRLSCQVDFTEALDGLELRIAQDE